MPLQHASRCWSCVLLMCNDEAEELPPNHPFILVVITILFCSVKEKKVELRVESAEIRIYWTLRLSSCVPSRDATKY